MSAPVRRPALAPHAVLRRDELRREHHLVGPERVLVLDEAAAAIVRLCDGRDLDSLHAALELRFARVARHDVDAFVAALAAKGWIVDRIRDAGE